MNYDEATFPTATVLDDYYACLLDVKTYSKLANLLPAGDPQRVMCEALAADNLALAEKLKAILVERGVFIEVKNGKVQSP